MKWKHNLSEPLGYHKRSSKSLQLWILTSDLRKKKSERYQINKAMVRSKASGNKNKPNQKEVGEKK